MRKKRALITGVTGQDGSFLAELLLQKEYEVFGLVRRTSIDSEERMWRIKNILQHPHFTIIPGSLESYTSVCNAINLSKPTEVYHLGAQSFVKVSFDDVGSTFNINVSGTVNVLEACRYFAPSAKIYLACSSEMFGDVRETPQKETTPFNPRSPYGVTKCTAFYLGKNYRESYNMFVANGILFNHESERRGLEFVTRKITDGIARVCKGLVKNVVLGNLDAKRDWGFAGDYVLAMYLMLQQDKPDDFVVATGQTHTVRQFAETACAFAGLDFDEVITVSDEFKRPAEVNLLLGDASKAKEVLKWNSSYKLEELVFRMLVEDFVRHGVKVKLNA